MTEYGAIGFDRVDEPITVVVTANPERVYYVNEQITPHYRLAPTVSSFVTELPIMTAVGATLASSTRGNIESRPFHITAVNGEVEDIDPDNPPPFHTFDIALATQDYLWTGGTGSVNELGEEYLWTVRYTVYPGVGSIGTTLNGRLFRPIRVAEWSAYVQGVDVYLGLIGLSPEAYSITVVDLTTGQQFQAN